MGKIYDATVYERMYENYLTRYNEAKNKEDWFELMIRRAKEIIKYCKTYKGSYLATKETGNLVYQSYYIWYLRSKDEVGGNYQGIP